MTIKELSGETVLLQTLSYTFFLSGTNSFIASLAAVIVLCSVSFERMQRSNFLCKNCHNFSRSFDVYRLGNI